MNKPLGQLTITDLILWIFFWPVLMLIIFIGNLATILGCVGIFMHKLTVVEEKMKPNKFDYEATAIRDISFYFLFLAGAATFCFIMVYAVKEIM